MSPDSKLLGRVLYAEDEESSRVSISELLRREGYGCVTATDGVAAKKLLRENQFDCLISDIKMLGNTELELIRELPQIQAGLPVILVTGYPSVETAIESFQLPVVTYLVKPIDFPALLTAVRESVFRRVILQRLGVARASLQEWLGDVGRLAEGVGQSVRVPVSGPMETYLMVTYRNILEALTSLRTVIEYSLGMPPRTGSDESRLATPLLIIDALRDTIDVLEKTKDAFRSRELGDLRHRLEDLLQASKEQK